MPLLIALLIGGGCTGPHTAGVHATGPDTTPETPAAPAGAPHSLNDTFRSDDLDVEAFVQHFEGESREIARYRLGILATLHLEPGQGVADVGAGTGLFLPSLHQAVGTGGHVYAVDIAPRFIEHMQQRIADEHLDNVSTVLCDERTTGLKHDSVDVVFVCDTYHHFEYPADTLASIHAALRAGGRLVIVDFERIPGVTKEWLMGHVRCGKQTVIDEVTAAGFRLESEPDVEGLSENYVLSFARQ